MVLPYEQRKVSIVHRSASTRSTASSSVMSSTSTSTLGLNCLTDHWTECNIFFLLLINREDFFERLSWEPPSLTSASLQSGTAQRKKGRWCGFSYFRTPSVVKKQMKKMRLYKYKVQTYSTSATRRERQISESSADGSLSQLNSIGGQPEAASGLWAEQMLEEEESINDSQSYWPRLKLYEVRDGKADGGLAAVRLVCRNTAHVLRRKDSTGPSQGYALNCYALLLPPDWSHSKLSLHGALYLWIRKPLVTTQISVLLPILVIPSNQPITNTIQCWPSEYLEKGNNCSLTVYWIHFSIAKSCTRLNWDS